MNTKNDFTLDELCQLVDLPRRTVRYYVQMGLMDRPEGAGRGASYGNRHLEQLLEIKKWQAAGLSLERIGELLRPDTVAGAPLPPQRPRQRGAIEVWSHLVIDDGVELLLEPKRAGLSPEQVRALATGVMALYEQVLQPDDHKE
jgi:DNA-binding transcriptional MerR regulator